MQTVAAVCVAYLPVEHSVQTLRPFALVKVPVEQSRQFSTAVMPIPLWYVPLAQSTHTPEDKYFPEEQPHVIAFPLANIPEGHVKHEVILIPSRKYVPLPQQKLLVVVSHLLNSVALQVWLVRQSEHAANAVALVAAEYLPWGQYVHIVPEPSIE